MSNKGFNELGKQLKKMAKSAKSMEGTHRYSFDELFPLEFMSKYTRCTNIDEFVDNCGYPANNNKEFEAIPEKELNEYVRKVTNFSSWNEMFDTASEELFAEKLGFK